MRWLIPARDAVVLRTQDRASTRTEDGEAPAGTGQPSPHPVPVTPAHGGGIGFLQPHPARPPSQGDEGDKDGTSAEPHVRKKELKELLQSELGCFLETQKDTGAVEKIMQDLDENGDGEVDFQEYVVLVAALTVACNTFFWENA
ncbi:PREDICTED: protein S100-A1 [Charadrius vociferus]|uniref:protein S100-A1 n=1 Tax=Charadrius vociferus TaxID=50402 RepID=UPI0005212FCB|nr:PREDICTED: protein S100-A1 [Charadrius vociferus]